MADTITIYEVRYRGNDNAPLMMEPRFRDRADAEAWAVRRNGCGLRWGAYVKARRVPAEIAAKMLRLCGAGDQQSAS